jgi:hypothetical protein
VGAERNGKRVEWLLLCISDIFKIPLFIRKLREKGIPFPIANENL